MNKKNKDPRFIFNYITLYITPEQYFPFNLIHFSSLVSNSFYKSHSPANLSQLPIIKISSSANLRRHQCSSFILHSFIFGFIFLKLLLRQVAKSLGDSESSCLTSFAVFFWIFMYSCYRRSTYAKALDKHILHR